jgi:hypothetical protein
MGEVEMGKRVGYGRRLAAAAVAAVLGGAGSRAGAASVTLQDMGVKYAPAYTTVGVTLGGQSMGQVIAGPEQWHRLGGSEALGDNFTSFCIELTQDTWDDAVFTFEIGAPESVPPPGVSLAGTGGGMSKADYLRKLWALHAGQVVDGTTGAAFQTAVWDIVYDADFTLSAGNFRATGTATTLAQTWLTDVKNSQVAYTAPNLVALTNPEGQDQITVAPVPLPSAALGGLVVLAGMGLGRVRRTRRDGGSVA